MIGLIIMSLFFSPVNFEEEGVIVVSDPDTEEVSSEQEKPSDTDILIQYLEQKRIEDEEKAQAASQEAEEKAAAEKAAAEEAELLAAQEAELLQINRISSNGYTSQSNVVYGLANKYPFYIVGQRLISSSYSRYDYYVWVFDRWAHFDVSGNDVSFRNTSCKLFYIPYDGSMTSQEIDADTITIDGGLLNVFSNINQLDIPALYNINKTNQDDFFAFIEVAILLLSLGVGYSIMLGMLHGARSRI